MQFLSKKFEELSVYELYNLLKIRYDVFVNEQQSIYDEFDNKDQESQHFLVLDNNQIVGYSRAYLLKNKYVELGRIVFIPEYRKQKKGEWLIEQSILAIKSAFPAQDIKISAQYPLKKYYSGFGFEQISNVYDDGGIPHIDMLLKTT